MQVVEPDQVDILPFTVPSNLQQIGDAEETGLARKLRRDLRKLDGLHCVDFDLAFVHTVAGADLDVWTSPDPHAAGYLSPTDSFPKTFCEDHVESLRQVGWNADLAGVRPVDSPETAFWELCRAGPAYSAAFGDIRH